VSGVFCSFIPGTKPGIAIPNKLSGILMLKNVIVIFFLSINFSDLKAQTGNSQKSVSDSINIVKTLMRKDGSVTSYATGFGGTQSKQFQRFVYLVNHLNSDEFLELTKDTSTCLRVYAYAGLAYNHYKKIASVKTQFQNDSTVILYMAGCLVGNVRANAIISNLKQWYSNKTVAYALKQQTGSKTFWYINFVFRD
jgi:hypothetical protein